MSDWIQLMGTLAEDQRKERIRPCYLFLQLSLWSCPRLSPLLKATAFARWPFSHRPVVPLAPLASVVALLLQADMAKDPSFWP